MSYQGVNQGGMRPQWVMCGGEYPDGSVCLIASNSLSQAELELEAQGLYDGEFESWSLQRPRFESRTITITATMKSIFKIVAPDWQAAFRSLFEQWDPKGDSAGEIGAARRQLPMRPGGQS